MILTTIELYVDDLLLAGSESQTTLRIKTELTNHYEMTDLGEARVYLEITRCSMNRQLFLVPAKYSQRLLERFRMEACKAVTNPKEDERIFDRRLQASKNRPSKDLIAIISYREAIGSITYLMTETRPNPVLDSSKPTLLKLTWHCFI